MPVTASGHAAFDALAGARHADPFGVLGPHLEGDTLSIRTFQPGAEKVEVARSGLAATDMIRVHPSGVFEAEFAGTAAVFDYRLRVTYPGGYSVEIDDPYRYGRV